MTTPVIVTKGLMAFILYNLLMVSFTIIYTHIGFALNVFTIAVTFSIFLTLSFLQFEVQQLALISDLLVFLVSFFVIAQFKVELSLGIFFQLILGLLFSE